MRFAHVDVFAPTGFTGNSLTVFRLGRPATADQLLAITQEFRHFESVFVEPTAAADRWSVRVFDLVEELEFAGHPLLGAAAALHADTVPGPTAGWTFDLPERTVRVETVRTPSGFDAVLHQGRPEYGATVTGAALTPTLDALGLTPDDLVRGLDAQVVSTGLRYLLLPVRSGVLERAAIGVDDLHVRLERVGAQFVYLLDVDAREGRHWNNDGRTEDVATGSAAGVAGAYLARHGIVAAGESWVLHQGRFTGRPSTMVVTALGSTDGVSDGGVSDVVVAGGVTLVAEGTLRGLPG